MDNILSEIKQEREKQFKKWGIQRHSAPEFIAILTEEVGEAAQQAVDLHFNNKQTPPNFDWDLFDKQVGEYRKELIQVAAVAVQMIESIDDGEVHRKKQFEMRIHL